MKLVVAVAVIAIGCGRVNFEALSDGAGATGDSPMAIDGANACAHDFCDSFERVGPIGQGWAMTELVGSVTLSLANEQLSLELDQTADEFFLVQQFPAPTSSVTVSMKLGYTTTNAGVDCEIDLVRMRFEGGTCMPFGFYLVRDGTDQFNLQETNGNATCSGNRNNYMPELTAGLHDIVMRIDIGAPGTARARLFVDGTMTVDRTTLQTVPSAPISLRLGGHLVRNAAGRWTITYDDVSVDVD